MRNKLEEEMQKRTVLWCDMHIPHCWKLQSRNSSLNGVYIGGAFNKNQSAEAREGYMRYMGEKLKDLGRNAGYPDFNLPIKHKEYSALFIEFKTPTGTVSTEQKWWLKFLQGEGNYATVCRSYDEAVNLIRWYVNDIWIENPVIEEEEFNGDIHSLAEKMKVGKIKPFKKKTRFI